jgi:hypothetical protein
MRLLGSILMALGILVGIGLAGFMVLGGGAFGLTWLLSVAIAKLTFLGSIGLLGAGAVLHRIDRRLKDRVLLEQRKDAERR